jgi:hypothetical protein
MTLTELRELVTPTETAHFCIVARQCRVKPTLNIALAWRIAYPRAEIFGALIDALQPQ